MDKQINKDFQEHIDIFNQWAMNIDLMRIPIGLYHGKMGLCIYFYELAKLTSEKKYQLFAEKLLDNVINNIDENIMIDPENGLTGICMAINYLLEKKYIAGNPNYVLKDFDDKIIQSLLFNPIFDIKNTNLSTINALLGNLVYLTIRLQNTKLSKDERHIIQGVIIENINKIESYEIEKFTEPTFFSVTEYFTPLYLQLLKQIYQLHFYDYKIEKIVKGLSSHILYRYPLNKANRLLLCSTMSAMNTNLKNIKGWDEHIDLLQHHIDVTQIIQEFRNKNISFFNGLSGFYYLLRKTGCYNEYKNLVFEKIRCSEVWYQLFENDNTTKASFGLYGGLSGVFLTLMHIMQHSELEIFFDHIINQYV